MELLIFGISLLTGWVILFLIAVVVMRFAGFFVKIWSSLIVLWASAALILSTYLFFCWIAGDGSALWAKIAAAVLAVPLLLIFGVWGLFRIWISGYSAFDFFDELIAFGRKKTKEASADPYAESRRGFFSKTAFFRALGGKSHKNKRGANDSASWSSYSFGTSGWESGMNKDAKARGNRKSSNDSSEQYSKRRDGNGDSRSHQSIALEMGVLKAAQAYAVLGISQNASDEEAKNAYLQLMKFCHPDMTRNLPDKQQQTAIAWSQRINDAWDTVRKLRGI